MTAELLPQYFVGLMPQLGKYSSKLFNSRRFFCRPTLTKVKYLPQNRSL